jgi:hypothetical protein
MDDTTPTELRANLFKILERVARGLKVKVRTKLGVVLIVPETLGGSITREMSLERQNVRGKIRGGTLSAAEKALKTHLKLPK